jgi:hypothetical protein
MQTETLNHQGVLNFTAKYLARQAGAPLSECPEAWRFPMIENYRADQDNAGEYGLNRVTFVWVVAGPDDNRPVSVVGTFSRLYEPVPLETVRADGELTRYRAATVLVPNGQVHTYKFLVESQPVLDPINPQRVILDNGVEWSRFFTQLCMVPLSFERWELEILVRLTNHILPFRSTDAQRFMNLFYMNADRQARSIGFPHVFRLEQPVGAVNFIDKLLAREERHRLIDYKICLRLIDSILRQRHPGLAPAQVPLQTYEDLYKEMADGIVNGWDTNQYQSPNFFLQLLRRHTFTGAFSHPKYGGNSGAAGWAYLEEMYRGPDGQSCFNWRRSIEQPLGSSADYFG